MIDSLLIQRDFIFGWLAKDPKTDEIRRSFVMIKGSHYLVERYRLSLMVSELGASARLNIIYDQRAVELVVQPIGARDPLLTLTLD